MIIIIGTIIGAIVGAMGQVVWMLITGISIAMGGVAISGVKRYEYDTNGMFRFWLAIGIGASLLGIMLCLGAVIGFYFASVGWLLAIPIACSVWAGNFIHLNLELPAIIPEEKPIEDIRIQEMTKKLLRLKDPEHRTLGELSIDIALHSNELNRELEHVKRTNLIINSFTFSLIIGAFGLIWWLIQCHVSQ